MQARTLTILILLVILGTLGFKEINKFFRTDNCLDNGGRWNEKCDCCEQGNPDIVGTSWISLGSHFANDTLNFISTSDVEYFMGELEWTFNSKYEQSSDTVTILTKTIAFEVDDVSKFSPDLKQTYILTQDSLILLKLENSIGELWESASPERMRKINNFARIRKAP